MATDDSEQPWIEAGVSRTIYYRQLRSRTLAENIRHPTPPSKPLTKKQRDAWTDINETIMGEGGAVVSRPMEEPMRFECAISSDLPEVLRYCYPRYAVVPNGSNERLCPQVVAGNTIVAPATVAVFLLRLSSVDDA
jgi:hypothetical protein